MVENMTELPFPNSVLSSVLPGLDDKGPFGPNH